MITSGRPVCRWPPTGGPGRRPVRAEVAGHRGGQQGDRDRQRGADPVAVTAELLLPVPAGLQVGRSAPSLKFPATGLGSSREPGGCPGPDREEEEAVAAVRGSGVGSAKADPLRVIPERGQVTEDFPEPARAERRDVLQEDVSGS